MRARWFRSVARTGCLAVALAVASESAAEERQANLLTLANGFTALVTIEVVADKPPMDARSTGA